MKNQDRYKTVEERIKAFDNYCNTHDCNKCQFRIGCEGHFSAFRWLELEAEEEQPLPCPFCGNPTIATTNIGGLCWVQCEVDCGYSSPHSFSKSDAIAAHNKVAMRVCSFDAEKCIDEVKFVLKKAVPGDSIETVRSALKIIKKFTSAKKHMEVKQ